MIKLAVGSPDLATLAAFQAKRIVSDPPLRHRTRNRPRRAAEILDGGSIYWVVAGRLLARQRIVDVIADRWEDGTACTGLVLDPALVAVAPRAMKPFQGWRYLEPADAPADLASLPEAKGVGALPPALQAALRELGLI